MQSYKRQQGFSLLEMSVVIGIIALLAGSIFLGQQLFRTAGLKSIIDEQSKYLNAIYLYKDRHRYFPGDDYGGTGNYDGKVDYAAATNCEASALWIQLSQAGMIQGFYNGYDSNSYGSTGDGWRLWFTAPGSNYTPPASYPAFRTFSLGKNGYVFRFLSNIQGFTTNMLMYAARLPDGQVSELKYSSIPVIDAFNIDAKIDDGGPSQGYMLALAGSGDTSDNCTSGSGQNYNIKSNITASESSCVLYFRYRDNQI